VVSDNEAIKSTTKVRVSIKMDKEIPIDPYDTSEFVFKSSIKYYIDTTDD
jgi:hypothetical protein